MTNVTIQLPDDLKAIAENKAVAQGFSDPGEFLSALLARALTDLEADELDEKLENYEGPSGFVVRTKAKLEQKLLHALDQILSPIAKV
ncbi:MAG: hypothetical protein L0215_00280 [Gemmataceae bacterium]|nr:hypothetical protein [Gemmataceae bacterium]